MGSGSTEEHLHTNDIFIHVVKYQDQRRHSVALCGFTGWRVQTQDRGPALTKKGVLNGRTAHSSQAHGRLKTAGSDCMQAA